jgi:hypothetical protein
MPCPGSFTPGKGQIVYNCMYCYDPSPHKISYAVISLQVHTNKAAYTKVLIFNHHSQKKKKTHTHRSRENVFIQIKYSHPKLKCLLEKTFYW